MIRIIKSLIESFNFREWILPLLIILIGIIAGIIFKKYIHSALKRFAKKSSWEGDDIVLRSIESYIVIWFFLAAFSLVVRDFPISDNYSLYISKILTIILIWSISVVISRVSVGLFDIWAKTQARGFPSTTMFTNFVAITIYIIGLLIILDALEVSIAPMLTAFGIGGLAISLALKDTLSDVFAGLHILLSKKVQPGDFIQLDSGEMGYVENISWRNTTLMERTNNVIHIPNTKLSSAIVKNYDSGDPSFSVKIPIGISYDSDLNKIEKITNEVINDVQNSLDQTNKNYNPAMVFKSFGDSSINIMIYFRGNKYGDQNPIIHLFMKKIHKRYSEEGIEIPFPIRTLIHKNKIS